MIWAAPPRGPVFFHIEGHPTATILSADVSNLLRMNFLNPWIGTPA
jgi:hypothetical protein